MILDEEQLYRDDLAERRRERDRQREPGRFHRPGRDLAGRHAFEVAIGDTAVTALACPACNGPVFAPGDSDRERIDCSDCDARLVTRRGAEGVELIQLEPDGAA